MQRRPRAAVLAAIDVAAAEREPRSRRDSEPSNRLIADVVLKLVPRLACHGPCSPGWSLRRPSAIHIWPEGASIEASARHAFRQHASG